MTFLTVLRIIAPTIVLSMVAASLSIDSRIVDGQSVSQNVEGTLWKGTVDVGKINEFDSAKSDFTFLFQKDGTVKLAILNMIYGYEIKQQYNSITGRWEQAAPVWNPQKSVANGNEVCTYKQTGKSVKITCNRWSIDASIQNKEMDAEMNLSDLNKKAKWKIIKVENTVGTCSDFRDACKSGNSFACDVVRILCN